MSDQRRTQSGVPAGGEYAVSARTTNAVTLTPERRRSEAEAILDAALVRLYALDAEVVSATLTVVAQEVLRVCPQAVYLTLDEDHEYGARVRAGSVLDANFEVLADDLSDFGAAAGVGVALGNLRDLESTDGCPAISDRFADDHAWSATGERRLHLATAAGLLDAETKQVELEEFDRTAIEIANQAPSYPEATAALKESMSAHVARTVDADVRGPITDWSVDTRWWH